MELVRKDAGKHSCFTKILFKIIWLIFLANLLNMPSIFFLFLYLFISFALAWITANSKPIFSKNIGLDAILIVLPISVFSIIIIGFRPFDAGGDTQAYIDAYRRISSPLTATSEAMYATELLFWPTQSLIKIIANERAWLAINLAITIILSFFAYKKILFQTKISPLLFSLIFLTFFGVYTGNAMRQVYAIPLMTIAFYSLANKKYAQYLFFILLSAAFHWSSLIFLISPVFLSLKREKTLLFFVPVIALTISLASKPLIESILIPLNIEWLNHKIYLYLQGGRNSHISEVYETLNFWLCIFLYITYTTIQNLSEEKEKNFSCLLTMIISVMLFLCAYPDLSERYMVYFIFLIPVIVYRIIYKIKLPNIIKNGLFLSLFFILGLLVYSQNSAKITLGL